MKRYQEMCGQENDKLRGLQELPIRWRVIL